MDEERAAEILHHLARGIDPDMRKPFDWDPLLSRPDVIRALFMGARALEHQLAATEQGDAKAKPSRKSKPDARYPKAGMPWTPEDEAYLKTAFARREPLYHVIQQLGRSRGSIRARLEHLGLIGITEDIQTYLPDTSAAAPGQK